jgi:hypothetical protein
LKTIVGSTAATLSAAVLFAFSTAMAYAWMPSYSGSESEFGVLRLAPNFFFIASRKVLFSGLSMLVK